MLRMMVQKVMEEEMTLYLAAMPALTALVLTAAVCAFHDGLMGNIMGDAGLVPNLGMATVVVATAGLFAYVLAKRALSFRLVAMGMVPAVLAGLTVPLALDAPFQGNGQLLFGAAAGAMLLLPFIVGPLAMARIRHG